LTGIITDCPVCATVKENLDNKTAPRRGAVSWFGVAFAANPGFPFTVGALPGLDSSVPESLIAGKRDIVGT